MWCARHSRKHECPECVCWGEGWGLRTTIPAFVGVRTSWEPEENRQADSQAHPSLLRLRQKVLVCSNVRESTEKYIGISCDYVMCSYADHDKRALADLNYMHQECLRGNSVAE